jgi:enoyl-CoA hydratase/carnithine racemase
VNGFKAIIYEKNNGIARITLDRPEALNAYNIQMRDELFQVLGVIRDDPEIKVGIFSGAGERAFCAGADLTEFLTAPPPVMARRARWGRDIWGLFLSLKKPLIAALHGYILGSGLEISLCCDIRLASEDARFGLPESGLGIIPAAGGSQTLSRAAGKAPALDMLLTGRLIEADEALRMKLVNRVVRRADLLPEAGRLAERIKGYDARVVRLAKEAVVRGLDLSLAEGLALEARLGKRLLDGR